MNNTMPANIPDFISVGSKEHKRFLYVVPYLNGEVVDYAIAADVANGWVDRYKTKDGVPYMENDEIVTERIYGRVEWGWGRRDE